MTILRTLATVLLVFACVVLALILQLLDRRGR